jgi:hypothetical protein
MKGLNAYARMSLIGKLFLPVAIIVIFNLFLKFVSSAEKDVLVIALIVSMMAVLFLILYMIFYPRFMNKDVVILNYDNYLYDLIKSYEEWAKTIRNKIETIENTDARKFIIGKKHSRKWNPDREEKLLNEATINKEDILQEHYQDLEHVQEQLNYYLAERAECAKFLEKFHLQKGEPSQQIL